ncbi:hypothetical protein KAI92_02050 [Candidatus Parcubacteria bacterium]|nr:hypothetical protein [Candidatus Parcubacteria bacterium]
MLVILQKFNKLPDEIRGKVSDEKAMAVVNDIEKRYKVNLAIIIMRVMIKDIPFSKLKGYFMFENDLSDERAEKLFLELKEKIFKDVLSYLGIRDELKENYNDNLEIKKDASEPLAAEFLKNSLKKDVNYTEKTEKEKIVLVRPKIITKIDSVPTQDSKELKNKILSPLPKSNDIKEEVISEKIISNNEEVHLVKDLDIDIGKDNSVEHEVVKVIKDKSNLKDKVEQKIQNVISELKISFASSELKTRFEQILRTYLRGVRNRITTIESLGKSPEFGGLSFNSQLIDLILNELDGVRVTKKIISDKKNNLKEYSSIIEDDGRSINKKKDVDLLEALSSMDRDVEYDYTKLKNKTENNQSQLKELERNKEKLVEKNNQVVDQTEKKNKVDNNIEDKKEVEESDGGIQSVKEEQLVKNQEFSRENVINVRQVSPINTKKVSDVKQVPKLMGPIDELKEMDLVIFRRLGVDTRKCTQKIKEKVSILERDGYGQRLIGIKAWRKSPINMMYIGLGNEAINKKVEVDIVINEKQKNSEDVLTKEEFRAIMDLNRELRF